MTKTNSSKTGLKWTKFLFFNHRTSFDTGLVSASCDGNSHIMVLVDAFTNYLALNLVPNCNAYHACTSLHDHWIAKF